MKKERCEAVAMIEIIEKRALVLFFKIQVEEKEKQILDNKLNKYKILTKSLNNDKNTLNLLQKLELFLVPIKGRNTNV